MRSSKLLLIHPPDGSPALPCWDAAVVAGSLSGSGLNPVHYDANLDFYLAPLLPGKSILAGIDLNRFRGKEFYDPSFFISCKDKINTGLTLVSHAHGKENPVSLWEKGLEKQVKSHDPGSMIFFISSFAQAFAAQRMAVYIKARHPGICVLAMAKKELDLVGSQYFDHLVWNQDQNGLASLIQSLNRVHQVKIDSPTTLAPQTIVPDFRGVPLDKYLIPESIFPVNPLFFKDPVLLSDFLEDQVGSLGVRGFVFAGDSDRFSMVGMCRQLAHWFSIKPPSVFFSLRVGLGETFPEGENQFSHLFSAGLRMIIWEVSTKKSQICTKTLWEASKQGIWNHLTGPDLFGTDNGQDDGGQAKFIANNPNIVHSFQNTDQDFTGGETQHLLGDDVGLSLSKEFMDYAGVKPLPGVPFWSILGDPNFLLAYLSQSTKKSLACLRADLTDHSLFCLGRQMTFTFQSPKDLPPGVLDEICKMVDAGGSVDITHVRFNLERAYLVGYAMENGVIIGNSSLKHPRTAFIKRLKTMTGVDFTNFVERGYTSVRPEYRSMGVGAKLLDGLTKRAKDHKIFSIISEENLATQKIAIRNNTKKILTYFSEKLNKEMGVWMPKEMIDNSLDGDKEK